MILDHCCITHFVMEAQSKLLAPRSPHRSTPTLHPKPDSIFKPTTTSTTTTITEPKASLNMPPKDDPGNHDGPKQIERPWLQPRKRRGKLPSGIPSAPIEHPYSQLKPIEQHLGFHPTDFSTLDPNPVDYRASRETTKQKLIRLSSLANRKTLSVDSPSFTPGTSGASKSSSITSQAANAAPFTPRGLAAGKICHSFDLPFF